MKDLFVYGTLLNDEVLEIILEHTPAKCSARLPGYKRVKVLGERYPAIRPDESSEVEGVLLTNLSDTDLARLDQYEGEYYERKTVLVMWSGEVGRHCMTYVFKPKYYTNLSSEPWCNESFREQFLQQYLSEAVDEH